MTIQFTELDDPAFCGLIAELENYFMDRYGAAEYEPYRKLNAVQSAACALVAYEGGTPVGCCCWKPYDAATAEFKRMYVRASSRGRGIAREMLRALEQNAAENGCHRVLLETGADMDHAVALYLKCGYTRLPEGYGAYRGDPNSACFVKSVSDGTMR